MEGGRMPGPGPEEAPYPGRIFFWGSIGAPQLDPGLTWPRRRRPTSTPTRTLPQLELAAAAATPARLLG